VSILPSLSQDALVVDGVRFGGHRLWSHTRAAAQAAAKERRRGGGASADEP
jgi:hypothetical protein